MKAAARMRATRTARIFNRALRKVKVSGAEEGRGEEEAMN